MTRASMVMAVSEAAKQAERTIRRTPDGHRSPSAEVDL